MLDTLPDFFKVYINHHSSQKMLVPYEFMEHLGRIQGGGAWLTGASGETWVVELAKEGNEMYFKEGWKVFVKENMIAENDFIFFKYHGIMQFSVRIFDYETKCEKILPLRAKRSVGRGTYGSARVEKEVGVGRKLSREGKRSNLGSSHGVGRGRLGPPLTVEEEEPPMICSAVKPFFVKKMTKSSVGACRLLKIPASFIFENSLHYQRDEKMVIRTEESSWVVNIVCNDNGHVLSGGWYSFVRDNNIKEGDIWTFELVHRLELMAHGSSGGM